MNATTPDNACITELRRDLAGTLQGKREAEERLESIRVDVEYAITQLRRHRDLDRCMHALERIREACQ